MGCARLRWGRRSGQMCGELCGHAGEEAGGAGEGQVEWGEIGGDGQQVCEPGRELVVVGHGASEAEAGNTALAGEPGDFADWLPHETGTIQSSFTGDDKVGPVNGLAEVGVAGEEVEARLQSGAGEGLQSEAESAGGTGAGPGGAVALEVRAHDLAEASEGSFGEAKIGRGEAFLGSVDAGGTAWAEERILHVGGDDDFHLVQRRVGWGSDGGEVDKIRPTGDGLGAGGEEPPAQAAGEAESGVVGGASADAEEAVAGFGAGGGEQGFCEALGIEVEGVVTTWGQHGESDAEGGFDDGGVVFAAEPPGRGAGTVGGVAGAD